MTPICTIDGPSGSGKGTICALVAQHFNWHLLDSGAIYRVVAVAVLEQKISTENHDAVIQCARNLEIDFPISSDFTVSVMLNGQNVTEQIRHEITGQTASKIAVIPEVRAELVGIQRGFAKAPGLVADGRDMGTVIFPDALAKFYLTASAEERAKRRYNQLKAQGNSVNLPELLQGIIERDKRDQSRATAPLKPAEDARQIDTTTLSIQEVSEQVIKHINTALQSSA